MPPKPKSLSSLFRSTINLKTKTATAAVAAQDVALKEYVSAIDLSASETVRRQLLNYMSPKPKAADSSSSSFFSSSNSQPSSDVSIRNLKLQSAADFEESELQHLRNMSSMLGGGTDLDLGDSHDSTNDEDGKIENFLGVSFFKSTSNSKASYSRKEISRERKQKWLFHNSQNGSSDWLSTLGKQVGPTTAIQLCGQLGREITVKDYSVMIGLCIQRARKADDNEASLQEIAKAYDLFEQMKDRGFQIKEETYGPYLLYLIDFGMVQDFFCFCELMKDESSLRLAYYEMLLWLRVDNEEKIQELCYNLAIYDGEDKSFFQENYLLAFCESNRRKELLLLLETFDITKVSSVERVGNIFSSLGKLLLESFAEKFIMRLKFNDTIPGKISDCIYSYATGIPNLAVEDIILKFKNLHVELEVMPTPGTYEKLIQYCCKAFKVHVALDLVEEMFGAGFIVSLNTFHSLLDACIESYEYNLVRRIYPMVSRFGLKPNIETFRIMINLNVKMKDFEGAYGMITDVKKMNLIPTASVYNAIMAGYFREKNIRGALMVLKQMEDANVKPDSQTYSYLLGNCNCEEDINKIFDEMKCHEVQATKYIYMALINAYAACGQFEKAKQVILDKKVPLKSLNEIKSVLVSALASHGEMSDALNIYDEIKQAKCSLESKAVIYLIEHLHSEGELNRLLQLLEELDDPDYWLDGCFRVVLYCVRHEHLRSAVDLLKQLKDKVNIDEVAEENLFDEVFCQIAEKELTDMQFGLSLLQAFKEELGLRPSRKSLDFLLAACLNAKDLTSCFLIWKEYQAAGLPYNVMSFLRMYQALLALGDYKSAANILNKIPKDDPDVTCIIKACQGAYKKYDSRRRKKKK